MKYTAEEKKQLHQQTKTLLKADHVDHRVELEQLREVIRFHEWLYYVQDDPVISDFEYDQLYKLLEAAEQRHSDWITPDSPTQRVSSDLAGEFESVQHLRPMLSLENSYNAEDLRDFDARVKKLAGLDAAEEIVYFAEPKFDGGSIAVIYENDELV
ncbi:MAG TPA: DNA ligase (NAD(+)) LigA, partial [Saprospiraceae bacterium]|nr:DNA ligase (NAD(+)) LigA [Saprospiraceae bacterium]